MGQGGVGEKLTLGQETRAAQKDSVWDQRATHQRKGESSADHPTGRHPASQGWGRTSSGSPMETAAGEPERQRRTGHRERFPPSAERGSSAAAPESGHHGCLYYPPSNSNFFPSLLTNYPASVLISFYYWN